MNWSKAKTILIVAFIITNILLAYMLFSNETIDEPTIKEDFIQDSISLLKSKNIIVDCEIPKEIPSLSMLSVEYEKRNTDEVNKIFFNGTSVGVNKEEGILEFKKDWEKVTILDGKELKYENLNKKKKYTQLNEEEAIHIAMNFLKEKKYETDDMKLSFIKKQKGIYYLEYTKVYDKIYIEKTYTNFQIDERGVKSFERLWLNTKAVGENQIYISTAPKAILGLLTMEENYGKTIEDISLCYHFDPSRHGDINDPKNTKEGKAIPAWRIQFNDGSKILLDEY